MASLIGNDLRIIASPAERSAQHGEAHDLRHGHRQPVTPPALIAHDLQNRAF
jgi:hypothetical protein